MNTPPPHNLRGGEGVGDRILYSHENWPTEKYLWQKLHGEGIHRHVDTQTFEHFYSLNKSAKCLPDLLKVNFFAWSEFSLIQFCAELCAEVAIKKIKDFRKHCQMVPKYKREPVFQVPCSKGKILRRFHKIMRGHAYACLWVLEALGPTCWKEQQNAGKGSLFTQGMLSVKKNMLYHFDLGCPFLLFSPSSLI